MAESVAVKYGEPFERKNMLKRGDIKKIEDSTPYSYSSIIKMLDGDRTMQPEVLTVANKIADEREKAILELSK